MEVGEGETVVAERKGREKSASHGTAAEADDDASLEHCCKKRKQEDVPEDGHAEVEQDETVVAECKEQEEIKPPATATTTDGGISPECSSRKRKQEEVHENEQAEVGQDKETISEDEGQRRGTARPRTSMWAWMRWLCEFVVQLVKVNTCIVSATGSGDHTRVADGYGNFRGWVVREDEAAYDILWERFAIEACSSYSGNYVPT